MDVGIDAISFYTPPTFLELATLAQARGLRAEKYIKGLGQHRMSVPCPGEDIVTMAANAAARVLRGRSKSDIDLLLFATESSIDQSKAAGIFVHDLLGLPSECRVIELKQACYSATFGLQTALSFIKAGMAKKVLLIASDIARYGLRTPGESSQGAAAVALIVSENPRLITIEDSSAFFTYDVMDFFRPNYSHEAVVDGKYSCELYLTMLKKSWQAYQEKTRRTTEDFAAFCLHVPIPRLVEKGYAFLKEDADKEDLHALLSYSRQIGNCYTAAIFLGLCSLLECSKKNFTNKRIGFYSYGSGCSAEFFSGIVKPGYELHLDKFHHHMVLEHRSGLTVEDYERYYTYEYPCDGSAHEVDIHAQLGSFRLVRFFKHQRCYEEEKLVSRQSA